MRQIWISLGCKGMKAWAGCHSDAMGCVLLDAVEESEGKV